MPTAVPHRAPLGQVPVHSPFENEHCPTPACAVVVVVVAPGVVEDVLATCAGKQTVCAARSPTARCPKASSSVVSRAAGLLHFAR